jgi:release factor glutamine methyltransferase
VLLAHIVGRPRSWVLAHPEVVLTAEQAGNLESALARLEQGEPLPYILGHWEFFSLEFLVTPATLIPRPETELLVEIALDWLRLHPERRMALDVGTGTGCIAVALAVHNPDLRLLACDRSLEALRVAQTNIQRHGVQERVFGLQADLLPAIAKSRFDRQPPTSPADLQICAETLGAIPGSRWWSDGLTDPAAAENRFRCPAPGGLILIEIEERKVMRLCNLLDRNYSRGCRIDP